MLFLKAFFWETDLWVTLGDFMVKNIEIGKWNLYLKINWVEMQCDVRQVITIIGGTYVQKDF